MPNNPELMSQLINSPIMQNMMNDPELMRNMLAQNPMVSQVRNFSNLFIHYWCKLDICAVQLPVLTLMHTAVFLQIMERNPEFAQILNDPQLLRESMQLATNPVRYHP